MLIFLIVPRAAAELAEVNQLAAGSRYRKPGDADDAASPRRGAAKGDPEVLAKLADVLRKLDAIEPMRAAIERLSEKMDSIERRQGHGQDNEVDCSQYMFKV